MSKERELLERVLIQFGKWHMQAEYDWDSEYDLKKEIEDFLSTPEPTQDEGWQLREVYFHADGEPGMHREPAPRPEFVRLSEEEVNSLTYAPYEPYELICAVENRLVEKNRG